MSDKSFIEKLAKARAKACDSLLTVADGDAIRHTRIRGVIQGLDDAMAIFRLENKPHTEEGE